MITAPTVPDFQADNFKVNDRRQAVIKDNNRNRKLDQFATELQEMVDLANIEFQFVAETRTVITQKAGQVASDRQAVTEAKNAVNGDRQHVDEQKQLIDTTAGEVSGHAQQVASDKQVVAQNTQTATEAAGAANGSAGDALAAKNAAEELYGDLDAVKLAKTQSQQAASTATQQAGLADTARQGAEQALADALKAAADANVDINAALADYVPRSGADLGSNDLKARLTHNSGYMYIGAYNSSYGTGQLRVYWNDTDKQLNMGGAELVNVSLNASLLDKGAIPAARIVSTASRTSSATGTMLQAKAMNDHRSSGDHDGRYARLAVTNVFAADQKIEKDRPWINLKSPTSGLSGVEQAGGITIGESDNASISVTYTGDGRGHIGMGSVDVNTGIPANEAMELYYQNRNVTFFGDINLPESVTLKGDVSGLKVTNATYGEIVIGNRNANHTHYSSSTGSHYFYGVVRSQEGFNGDGSSVTNVNAVQLNGQSRSVNDDANTVAGRDSAGDIRARLFRSTYTSTNSNIAVIYTAAKSDGTDFMRPSTPAQVRAALDVDVPTGSNSNGRYYLYPDGRLVMHCGTKTFSQDPLSNRRLLASITLPYTPLGSAEHYVTVNPSSDAGDYTNASSPFDVSGLLVKPGRQSSGTVVEVRLLAQEGRTFASSATTVAPVLIESRWK
ncbi:hypothetical protein LMS44_18420 [Halomonas profundus]|nr:hypothetical protein LMS44_18420 [Halomonas profundus]|tara:strand:+ start:15953 stop:17974 length:2022 start_codon:yes stop_codon:yes gene_type:complete